MKHLPKLAPAWICACLGLSLAACSDYASIDSGQVPPPTDDAPGANTNVNFGGAQDFGYFRRLLNDGVVPPTDTIDEAGFFAEHHTPLPDPTCGGRICAQAMLGVMPSLIDGEQVTMLQVGLNSPLAIDPEDRPPLNIALVIDVSCSMGSDGKMAYVRNGLEQMIDALRDGDRVAFVTYSNDASLRFGPAQIDGRRDELRSIVRSLRPSGSTNLWGGLQRGYQEVFRHFDADRQNRVILLSDGQPTGAIVDTDQIIELSQGYNIDGVGLTTIGLGSHFNLPLMRGLSEQGDGNFYFVEDAAAVEEVFTQEVDFFTVPVAFDLQLDVHATEDFAIQDVHGATNFVFSSVAGFIDIPSVFLAHRRSHDDVTKGGGRRGGGSALLVELVPRGREGPATVETNVAKVTLSYVAPGEFDRREEAVAVVYPYAPHEVLESGYFENPIVTKSFVMLNILHAIETAVGRFHDGQGTMAIAVLRRVIAAVEDYEDDLNDGVGDVDMKFDIELMLKLVDVMKQNGAKEITVQDLPRDPWPGD